MFIQASKESICLFLHKVSLSSLAKRGLLTDRCDVLLQVIQFLKSAGTSASDPMSGMRWYSDPIRCCSHQKRHLNINWSSDVFGC